jgi:hypothetical protein
MSTAVDAGTPAICRSDQRPHAVSRSRDVGVSRLLLVGAAFTQSLNAVRAPFNGTLIESVENISSAMSAAAPRS